MKINKLTGFKAAVVITIDDVHPEKGCGKEFDTGPLKLLKDLEKEFGVKSLLFTTANWMYKPQIFYQIHRFQKYASKVIPLNIRKWEEGTFRLDKFKSWAESIGKKFEVGIHGLYHLQNSYPFGAEFMNLDSDKILQRIIEIEKIFKISVPNYTNIFRPPGWQVNDDFIEAVRKKYFLAASVDTTGLSGKANAAGILNVPQFYPHYYKDVLNITANCDIKTCTTKRIDEIVRSNGLVVLHGHITNNYHGEKLHNGVEASYENLKNLLIHLKNRYGEQIWYTTFSELHKKL